MYAAYICMYFFKKIYTHIIYIYIINDQIPSMHLPIQHITSISKVPKFPGDETNSKDSLLWSILEQHGWRQLGDAPGFFENPPDLFLGASAMEGVGQVDYRNLS